MRGTVGEKKRGERKEVDRCAVLYYTVHSTHVVIQNRVITP